MAANFDFDPSTALPWDLQRHLETLLAGQQQQQNPSSSSAQPLSPTANSSQHPNQPDMDLFSSFGNYRGGNDGGMGEYSGGMNAPGGGMMGVGGGDGGGGGTTTASAAGRSSLKVPFFRYFGPTAYTPGLRRVKVELRAEAEAAEENPSSSDQNEPTAPPVASLGRTPSFSSSSSTRPHHLDYLYNNNPTPTATGAEAVSPATTNGSHPSPDDGSSRRAGESPSRSTTNTMEETRRRQKSALFKKGREKAFPTDEIFEELLDTFFTSLSSNYPFLSKRLILSQHRSHTLPALLANSICALASRFSNHPLLLPLRSNPSNLWESALPFEEQAKQLLIPLLSFPTEETCTALVLLSYNEFGGGRDSGLFMYTGMAIRVVQDLGMQHEISLAPHQGEPGTSNGEAEIGVGQRDEIARRRLLFWAVFLLDRFISWGTGRRATIAESEIDVALPTVEDCELLNPPMEGQPRAPHPWPALIYITRHRGKISDSLNSPGGNTDLKSRERVERLQGNMIAFYSSMHPVLHFSVQSFKLYRDLNLSPAFLLLHLLFHSVITVLHRPSLLQNFSHGGQVLVEPNIEVSRSSARTLANMLSYADLAGPVAILANPFADQLIFISAMAFLDERVALELSKKVDSMGLGMSSSSGSGGGGGGGFGASLMDGTKTPTGTRLLRSFADSKLDVSISALKNITSHWAGVGWVIRTIEQKKRGFSFDDVDPDTDADIPSIVLFPRDPAMIKAWLAREWMEKVDTPKWDDGIWDETMLAMVPPDVGLSFTGQGLDDSHLTLSLDANQNFYQPDSQSPNPFEFPMEGLPQSFFSDVVWGGGGL